MSTDAESEAIRVVVGQVGRPFGVRGQVFVTPLTDFPELRLAAGSQVSPVNNPDSLLTIVEQRPQSGRMVVSFEGVDTREAAADLTGTLLESQVDPTVETGMPDEYFDHRLIGLAAVTPEGESLGVIVRVEHLPDQDSLVVKDEAAVEHLIPFVRQIVPSVDLEAAQVVVDAPEGLLNADEDPNPDDDLSSSVDA